MADSCALQETQSIGIHDVVSPSNGARIVTYYSLIASKNIKAWKKSNCP